MDKNAKIFVAGHRGLVGSAIVRKLKNEGYQNLVLKTRQELDLCDKKAVESFFKTEQPEYVFLAAAKVGGIQANNTYPADFIIQNIEIETNVIISAMQYRAKRLLFLGSSCIYPRECPQPIKEEYLLTGPLEPTNEPYAIAKIAGIKMCESINRQHGTDFRSLMPTNLYGPGDNFHPENSHVIPGLLRRFHEAKVRGDKYVNVWGSGRPRREFMHVDDLSSACVYIMNLDKDIYDNFTQPMLSHVNVGVGKDCSIKELAETIAEVVGFDGEICFDTSKPDGTPQKLLDISRISALGWSAKISLEEGLKQTYRWFLENRESLRVH